MRRKTRAVGDSLVTADHHFERTHDVVFGVYSKDKVIAVGPIPPFLGRKFKYIEVSAVVALGTHNTRAEGENKEEGSECQHCRRLIDRILSII
jgi:hypothetical protein